MDANLKFGLGWLPDIPSVKDFTPNTGEVAQLISRGNELARQAVPAGGTSVRGGSGSGSAGAAMAPITTLAVATDLRPWCSPIENQGSLGSCTANAAVALVEYFEKRAFGRYLNASRLFVYKTTRDLLGWKGDTGAYIRSTMGALALFGTPPEQYWPYNISQFDVEPTSFCYAFASSYKALTYYRLDASGVTPANLLTNIKTFLNGGYALMFGLPVYEEFMNPTNAQVAFPTKNSHLYGGHAIAAVGYDDNMPIGKDKGALLIRNSWGTGWGNAGYAWLSYRYVTEGLAVDWWSLLKADWVDTGQFGLVMP